MRRAVLALLAGAACACGARSAAPPAPSARTVTTATEALVLGPARYLLTDHLGVMFDEAGAGSPLPRAEPVVIDGVRLIVDGGLVVGSARHADHLSGFRSLPSRLGGGFVLWSEDRVYRADTFLGDLEALADVGATGGARPWLGSILLRTPSGLLEIDPASRVIRRATLPGTADALATDARRAARLDALGRASFTIDGGATWTDLTAVSGAVMSALREDEAGDLELTTVAGPRWSLGARGAPRRVEAPADRASALGEPRVATPSLAGALPTTSRALPGEIVAQAAAYGALIDGGRLVVTRENGVRVLATETGLPVADADLAGVDERFARCQAVVVGAPPRVALACAGEAGAEVLELDGALGRPTLTATFPGATGGFLGGPRGRLAFDGRCGPGEPRGGDLGPGTAKPAQDTAEESPPGSAAPPPPEPPGAAEPPPDDDARVCVRSGPSRWIERRLRGDDARRLYRWVPGDDGAVTALILGAADAPDAIPRRARGAEPPAPGKATTSEGVRVIRLDRDDAALLGGAFPALPAPQEEAPYRTVDVEFWQDDDGAVRGWVRLPAEGPPPPPIAPSPQGAARRLLRVSSARGGRSAGVRIDAAGHVAVLALPDGVAEVVTGGRFGLAMATRDGVETWFETLDGGARWTPIEGPPTGSLDAPADEHAPFACSPAGCAWGSGVVRLGWGSPPPRTAEALELGPARSPKPRDPGPFTLSCRLDAAALPRPAAATPDGAAAPPIALRLAASTLGSLRDHAWSGEVVPPFQPSAPLRHLSARDHVLSSNQGAVIPVLAAGAHAGVDLLLALDHHLLRAGAGSPAPSPFEPAGKPTIAADLPGGALVWLDADRGLIALSRGAATTPVLRLARVPEVSHLRLTLALRTSDPGLSLVGYSTSSGEVVVGDLDLPRAEVGALSPLGRLETLAEAGACATMKPTHRFLAEIPVRLVLSGKGGKALLDQQVTAAVWIAASASKLCALAVEAALPGGNAVVLSAALGKGAEASVRSAEKTTRAACAMGNRPP